MMNLAVNNIKWWYFQRKNNTIVLAPVSFFTYRPEDATESDNPMTPWYDLTNHINKIHVHVQASSYIEAYEKALKMIKNESNSIQNTVKKEKRKND